MTSQNATAHDVVLMQVLKCLPQRGKDGEKKERLIKARLNGCNILGQHHPTLLGPTYCIRLNTMLGHVGRCWIVLDDVG